MALAHGMTGERNDHRRRGLSGRAGAAGALLALAGLALGVAACGGQSSSLSASNGNLTVASNGKVAFQSATGFAQSFFSSDQALGPAQLIPLSGNGLVVHYSDPFSTFSPSATVGGSQEEVLVLARDPIEYRQTLESLVGPTGDAMDPGHFLDWARETSAPGDTWPIVATNDPVTHGPDGITLPTAVGLPFPDSPTAPQLDWPMAQAAFTGSPGAGFSGAAASFGGSIKGLSVMRHGVCSFAQSLTDSLGTLTSSVPMHGDYGVATYDVTDLGLSSFVSYAPKGGLVATLRVDGSELITTFSLDANLTYSFGLDDGVPSLDVHDNTWNASEVSGIAMGALDGLLHKTIPDLVKLSSLEGAPGTFTGGLAQPFPGSTDPDCGDTSKQRPAKCFTPCRDTDAVKMSDRGTWPDAEDLGDPNKVDPASWHDKDFCKVPAVLLASLVQGNAARYPGMTGAGPQALSQTITEDLNGDSTRFHNVRCNFHPRYEEGPFANGSVDPLTTGRPFGSGQKRIFTGPPVCELIVRVKRLNVLPDSLEAVFFDGPDLQHVDPSEFGNEAFAISLAAPGVSSSMCTLKPETAQVSRPFAHVLLH